jgi:O-antigen/teichoic acid export membrane protein
VAPLLIILAPLGILFALFSSSIAIFESQGHPDIFLRINLLYVGGLLLALSIGVTAGMYGVAWGYVLVTVVFVYISAHRALKIIDLTIRDVWLQIRGFFVSAVIMALIILSVRTMLFTNVAPIWDLSASIALGIVLYILTNLVINRDQVQQMLVHFHFQQMLARFHFRPRNSA